MTKDQSKADAIRQNGVEVFICPAVGNQKKELIEADVIKMIEDNMELTTDGDGFDIKRPFQKGASK